jgi:hypothetical protein
MILPLNWIVNHLFIRVIRGSIVFGRERLYDFFEARIISERTGVSGRSFLALDLPQSL